LNSNAAIVTADKQEGKRDAMNMMPVLETERLLIRPLQMADLEVIFHVLDVELGDVNSGSEHRESLAERESWLRWTIMGYEQFARLCQPPYGERGVALAETGELIGAVGFAPCLGPFDQLPALAGPRIATRFYATPEFGLFYAISPRHQRQGYAAEAAGAMIDYAFRELGLKRVIATTSHDNAASIGVMKKMGMQIETNPYPAPPWLQVVGVLWNS
jgi:[ribosomal protein S5]-alanine N-acetyltransferase